MSSKAGKLAGAGSIAIDYFALLGNWERAIPAEIRKKTMWNIGGPLFRQVWTCSALEDYEGPPPGPTEEAKELLRLLNDQQERPCYLWCQLGPRRRAEVREMIERFYPAIHFRPRSHYTTDSIAESGKSDSIGYPFAVLAFSPNQANFWAEKSSRTALVTQRLDIDHALHPGITLLDDCRDFWEMIS